MFSTFMNPNKPVYKFTDVLLNSFGQKFAEEVRAELGLCAAQWVAGFFAERKAQM